MYFGENKAAQMSDVADLSKEILKGANFCREKWRIKKYFNSLLAYLINLQESVNTVTWLLHPTPPSKSIFTLESF